MIKTTKDDFDEFIEATRNKPSQRKPGTVTPEKIREVMEKVNKIHRIKEKALKNFG
jgi:hypothetical protein